MDLLNDLIDIEYSDDRNDMRNVKFPTPSKESIDNLSNWLEQKIINEQESINLSDNTPNIRCDMAHNKDSWTSILSINQLDELSKLSKQEQDTIDKQMSNICSQILHKHNGIVQQDNDQAIKYDSEKTRVELLPYNALLEIAKVMTIGAKKYGDNNWRKGMLWSRLYGACLRHLIAWYEGQDKDEETGLLHLAHAGCCILFLITYQLLGLGTDNRIVNSNSNT